MADADRIIDKWLEDRRPQLLELLSQLIAARTENPPGNEAVAARVVAAFFQHHGIPFETHEAQPERTNIIGRVGTGAPALMLLGHLDTVPAGEDWTAPPFQATLREGRVYGRGSSDDKGPTAALLMASACVQECFRLKGTLLPIGVADEERGSALGLEWLMREKKVSADWAIVPDAAGNMRNIDVAEKGIVFVEIKSHGKQAHGSTPQKGVNAIWNLIDLLNRIRKAGPPAASHRLLSPPTLNLGQIRGGAAPNIVAGSATATLDIRLLPGQTPESTLAWLESMCAEAQRDIPNARFEMALISGLPATEVQTDSPLISLIRETTREVTGVEPELIGIGGATVTKQLIKRGIPAVGFSPGDEGQAHMSDESIALEELHQFARIVARIAVRLLGGEPISAR